jgi:hypothetical protein
MVTLDPTADLVDGADYVLVVGDDFGLDMSDNENGNAETTLFLTADADDSPYVIDWYPGDGPLNPEGEINKDDLDAFAFLFSENMYYVLDGTPIPLVLLTDAQVKESGIATLVDGEGNAIDYDVPQIAQNQLWLMIQDEIFDNTEYTVNVQGLVDADGNLMVPYERTLKTTDGIVPESTFSPEDEDEDVAEDAVLTITFNEQIYASVYQVGEFWFYAEFTDDNIGAVVYLEDEGGNPVAFTATFDGISVITITPDEPLESSAEYTYGTMAVIMDADMQEAVYESATFEVIDYIAPTFDDDIDVWPSKGEAGVIADADMEVLFSEDVVVSTGSVIIRNLDGTIFETIGAEGLSIDGGNTLEIDHMNFAPDAEYFVELDASVVVDKSGNPNAAYGDAVDGWTFTTKDTYGLEATVSPLGDNNPDVVTLQMVFNKDVFDNGGTFGHYLAVYTEDGTAVKQIDAEDLVILGNVVSYANLELAPNQAYYARIEPDAFKDASGNKFAGIMDNSWAFSTINNIAPVVTDLSPIDNSTAVDPATTYMMTFDRDIAIGTGMIAVRYSADGTLFEEVDVTAATAAGMTLTFGLTTNLDVNTEYYVIVPEGAVTNTEATKEPFAGILDTYTWNFTTADVAVVVPELVEWTPQGQIEGNHPTFVMTFADNVMFGEAGNLTVTKMDSTEAALTIAITADMIVDNTVTVEYVIDSIGGLEVSSEYFVNVDGGVIENEAGVPWAGISDNTTWLFTTSDTTTTAVDPVFGAVDYNVYPNPFNDRIFIDNNDKLTRVIVSNIAGQRVIDVEYPQHEIRTGALVSGLYFVNMFTESGIVKTSKMIKK